MIHEMLVANFITFAQKTTNNIKGLDVSNFLRLQGHVRNQIRFQHLLRKIGFQQSVSVNKTISLSASNILRLEHSVRRGPNLFAANYLIMWQEAKIVPYENMKQILTLSQTVSVTVSKGAYSSIQFTNEATVTVRRNLIASNTFSITQATMFLSSGRMNQIFVARSIVPECQFQFRDTILKIRAPNLGNHDKLHSMRIARYSRGGDIQVFRDSIWPQTRTLNLTFTMLNQKNVYDLLAFIKASVGRTVQYTDHHGIIWNGIIITPGADVVRQNRSQSSITIDFEGNPA